MASLAPFASAPPAYTSRPPALLASSQSHPEPIHYRVRNGQVFAEMPVIQSPPQTIIAYPQYPHYATQAPFRSIQPPTWYPAPSVPLHPVRVAYPHTYPYPVQPAVPTVAPIPSVTAACQDPAAIPAPSGLVPAAPPVPPPGYTLIAPSAQWLGWRAQPVSEDADEDDVDWFGRRRRGMRKRGKKEKGQERENGTVVKLKWFD